MQQKCAPSPVHSESSLLRVNDKIVSVNEIPFMWKITPKITRLLKDYVLFVALQLSALNSSSSPRSLGVNIGLNVAGMCTVHYVHSASSPLRVKGKIVSVNEIPSMDTSLQEITTLFNSMP